MSLRDDARWIEDALDSILFGALPLWPQRWSTVTGQRIAMMVQRLYKQRTDAMLATSMHEMEKARLLAEIDGLRATNEILTEQVETLERHQQGYLEALGVERRNNTRLTLQLREVAAAEPVDPERKFL